ncbi:MAG TPA: cation transporting ATPase C-terminal domain-containing protein [Burkholderiales bacterium]|nr:cation transporting ATPase C-terminal domain-containing protein [Burkholderiales bacterium]
MVTAITLSLAFESPEPDLMRRAPRKPGEALISGFLLWRILLVSLVMVTESLGLFLWETSRAVPVEIACTIAAVRKCGAGRACMVARRGVRRRAVPDRRDREEDPAPQSPARSRPTRGMTALAPRLRPKASACVRFRPRSAPGG